MNTVAKRDVGAVVVVDAVGEGGVTAAVVEQDYAVRVVAGDKHRATEVRVVLEGGVSAEPAEQEEACLLPEQRAGAVGVAEGGTLDEQVPADGDDIRVAAVDGPDAVAGAVGVRIVVVGDGTDQGDVASDVSEKNAAIGIASVHAVGVGEGSGCVDHYTGVIAVGGDIAESDVACIGNADAVAGAVVVLIVAVGRRAGKVNRPADSGKQQAAIVVERETATAVGKGVNNIDDGTSVVDCGRDISESCGTTNIADSDSIADTIRVLVVVVRDSPR